MTQTTILDSRFYVYRKKEAYNASFCLDNTSEDRC